MKFLKYIAAISLLLASIGFEASACAEPYFSPKYYYMFRVCEGAEKADERALNVKAWQQLVYADAEDVFEAVYEMPFEEYEKIYSAKEYDGDNEFVDDIKRFDKDICDFLLLAKANEYIRSQRNSRWYYPTMKTDAPMSLEEIAEKSLATKGKRLRDRYLLQAVRALYTLGRYQECIDVWDSEASKLPQSNLMRRMIYPYVAGAEFRVGRKERAMESFARVGDVESILYCSVDSTYSYTMSTVDALELIYKYSPNNDCFAGEIQKIVAQAEPSGGAVLEPQIREDLLKLKKLALRVASEGRSNEPAMLLYTAAFISELCGHTADASNTLARAEKASGSGFVKESIKVMRIYLDAKTMPLNAAYEARLLGQLKWFDRKIASNITDDVAKDVADRFKMPYGHSFYYWNDMMRRVLLGELCPRLLKAGMTTRALQLANMADNHLPALVGYTTCLANGEDGGDKFVTVSLGDYRRDKSRINYLDYNNHFFRMIDAVDAEDAMAYLACTQNPGSEFDRFVNARSYVDADYLNDIVGTLCLRSMRYDDAERHLGKVSYEYDSNMNEYFKFDPFSFNHKKLLVSGDYKYNFACQMNALERSLQSVTDSERRAQLMYRFAVGLRNSFEKCWALTSFHRCTECHFDLDCMHNKYITAAMQRSSRMIDQATGLSSDKEFLAMVQYDLCNFKTVAQDYANTKVGGLVRGSCDKLIDYHAEEKLLSNETYAF